MKWYDAALVGLSIGFIFSFTVTRCKAEDLSEIDARSASYCALYSRQMVFVDMMHGEGFVADTDIINGLAVDNYRACISILPTLLPLPKDLASHEQWLADIRDLMVMRAGRQPARDDVEVISRDDVKTNDEEWRAQCRAEYHTWDEDTATVIRRGSPERVRCPCGGEVVCGG